MSGLQLMLTLVIYFGLDGNHLREIHLGVLHLLLSIHIGVKSVVLNLRLLSVDVLFSRRVAWWQHFTLSWAK